MTRARSWILFALLTAAFCLYYGINAKHSDLSFDGAIFSQSVVALERYGVLANTYDVEHPSELHLALTNLSQGMLSQYLLNWPFIRAMGVDNFSLQMSNLIFLALAAVLLYLLIIRQAGNPPLGLLAVLLFFTYPRIELFGLRGFGEVPAFAYALLTVLLLHHSLRDSRYYPLLGFAAFLAFHTKHFLVLFFPMLLVILIYLWLFERSVRPRDMAGFSVAFVAPTALLHLFFLFRYGRDQLMKEYAAIRDLVVSGQWGTLGEPAPFGWHQVLEAINSIGTEWAGWALAFYLPLGIVYILSATAVFGRLSWKPVRLNLDARQVVILFLLVVSVFYVVYWYHFSVRLIWYRKLLPIMMLTIPLGALSLSYLQDRLMPARRKLLHLCGAAIFLPMLVVHLDLFASRFELKTTDEPWLRDCKEMVRVVEGLPPEARLFGTAWWQAPRIGLYADRFILDIQARGRNYSEGYLIFDHEALGISPEEVRRLLLTYDTVLVHRNPHYELYRWQIRDIPELVKRLRLCESFVLLQVGPSKAKAGEPFYPQPGGDSALWARTTNATPGTVVIWGETVLKTHVGSAETLTALVPRELTLQPDNVRVWLADFEAGIRSNEFLLQLLE
jgi:hypothetical protein